LDALLGNELLFVGDIILTEVLQGFSSRSEFDQARSLMLSLEPMNISEQDIAVKAAYNFRILRAKGITVRKTIYTLIATRCIHENMILLHSDRDFEPFTKYLGLRSFF
jgi:predicted nucleic acid-binding protein